MDGDNNLKEDAVAAQGKEREGKERLMLLCGKLEEDEYALDFAHPLSPVHAFAFFLCARTLKVPRTRGA